jgi:hypothetical protein
MNPRLSRFREIVIDTGPLLLYLVGSYDKRYLSRFSYDEYEFLLLIRYLSSFKKVYVTPQVLAEASNLARRRLKEEQYSIFIRRSIVLLVGLWEEYVAKDEILKRSELPRFGITDASLLSTVDRDKLLLTDDAPLFWYCSGKDMPVMHLDGIKSLIW